MVEYCSPVWSPVAVTLINQLESVQRRFTKRLPGFQTLPYDERCALLGLDRLELRRLRADLILCYEIIRGLVLLSPTVFSRLFARGHSFKLFLPDSRVNCRQHFSLPEDVVSAAHLSLFISRFSLGTTELKSVPDRQDACAIMCSVFVYLDLRYNNNNNDRLTAFDPGQPG